MPSASVPEQSERAAVAHTGKGVVASPRPCPVCGQGMTGGQNLGLFRQVRGGQEPKAESREPS